MKARYLTGCPSPVASKGQQRVPSRMGKMPRPAYDCLKGIVKRINQIEQISELPLSVSMVAREDNLIKNAQHTYYWSNCTDAALDELTVKLSPLMQFRELQNTDASQVKRDLTEVLHNKEKVKFGPQHEAVSISR
jgi:hypothetical protein